MKLATVLVVSALAAVLFVESNALTAGKKAKHTKTPKTDDDVKQSFKVNLDGTQTEAVVTRSGCACAESFGIGDGDCNDGDTVYSGCPSTPCDGDTKTDDDGTVWASWCHTVEAECAGNGGSNWDYCNPSAAAAPLDTSDDTSDVDRNSDGEGTSGAPAKSKKKSKKSKSEDDAGDADRAPGDTTCPDGQEWHAGKTGKGGKCKKAKGPKKAPKMSEGEDPDAEGRFSGSGSGSGSGPALRDQDSTPECPEGQEWHEGKQSKDGKCKKVKAKRAKMVFEFAPTVPAAKFSSSGTSMSTLAVVGLVVLSIGSAVVISRRRHRHRAGYDVVDPSNIAPRTEELSLLRSLAPAQGKVEEGQEYQYYLEY